MKKILFLCSLVFLTACSDKVAYVGYADSECKFVEINGVPMTCEEFNSEFEVVWVDSCLVPTEEDGVEASTEFCK